LFQKKFDGSGNMENKYDKDDWTHVGDEVADTVQKAIQSGIYTNLSRHVGSFAGDLFKEVKRKVVPRVNRKGEGLALMKVIIGAIFGLFPAPFLLIAFFGLLPECNGAAFITLFILGLIDAFFVLMFCKGMKKLRALKLAQRYDDYMRIRTVIEVETLAMGMHASERKTRKNLRYMIREGIFEQGHLDSTQQFFMMDDRTYNDFLDATRKKKEEQDKVKVEDARIQTTLDASDLTPEQKKQWKKAIEDGESYIAEFQRQKSAISEPQMKKHLEDINKVLVDIFEKLKARPAQIAQMRRFMEYYLPTTKKLVQKYQEFNQIDSPGEDVLEAKQEIEKTMGTIYVAFVEMRNNLFINDVYDVTTDAEALRTMLAKDSLVKDEWKR